MLRNICFGLVLLVLIQAVLSLTLQEINDDYDSIIETQNRLRTKILSSELLFAENNLFNKSETHMAALASSYTSFGTTYNYGGCTCSMLYCICCARVQVSESGLNTTSTCLNLRYNNADGVMSTEFYLKGIPKLMNETFKVSKTAPKFCYETVTDEKLCVQYYSLANSLDEEFVKGCVELTAMKGNDSLATMRMGCFSMFMEVGHSYFLKDIVSKHTKKGRSIYVSRHNPVVFAPLFFF
jgi:hypothetical protein